MLVKWYDVLKWLLERIDNFPKSQRFIFGQRLADHAVEGSARGHRRGVRSQLETSQPQGGLLALSS